MASVGRLAYLLVLTTLCRLAMAAYPVGTILHGEVVKIADGDTFTLLRADKNEIRVRLAEIGTPEKGQPYSNEAK